MVCIEYHLIRYFFWFDPFWRQGQKSLTKFCLLSGRIEAKNIASKIVWPLIGNLCLCGSFRHTCGFLRHTDQISNIESKHWLFSCYRACGHTFQLDMRHKLTTYMLKNPPGTKLNDTGTSLTERKEKKSKLRSEKNDSPNGGNFFYLVFCGYNFPDLVWEKEIAEWYITSKIKWE